MTASLPGSWLGPAFVFALATLIFLLLARSRWATSRAGGAFLGLAVSVVLGLALQNPDFRRRAADPENLALLIFTFGAAAVVWIGRRRARLDAALPLAPETSDEAGWSAAEMAAGGAAVLVTLALAFVFGAPLEPAYDPAAAPESFRAPWFLLALQEAGRHFTLGAGSLGAGLVLVFLFAVGLWLFPELDPRPVPESGGGRREALFVFLFAGFLLVLVPSLIGAFLRPGPPAAAGVSGASSLAELIWPHLRDAVPTAWFWRELPGLLLLGLYFGLLPFLLLRWRPTREVLGRYRRRLASKWSFALALGLLLLVLYVPLGLSLRAGLGIDALVALPEFGLRL